MYCVPGFSPPSPQPPELFAVTQTAMNGPSTVGERRRITQSAFELLRLFHVIVSPVATIPLACIDTSWMGPVWEENRGLTPPGRASPLPLALLRCSRYAAPV